MGTPGQTFTILLDKASSYLWVNSIKCNSQASMLHTLFNPQKASTYSSKGQTMSEACGAGSLTMVIGHNTVLVGGLKITKQKIGLSLNEPGSYFDRSV
ncbi:pepsin A-like [Sardina pilchardus]|uniref:pepsin A-like n=1 Tax=Sardina pilchardus TaxID=27697 RepID=UPI002E12D766